ncbi:hypothetical protein BDK51DRAFT_39671 [Blyttiomyces helicus]|uniref:Uncharacterized protein n=1 Tax=Blyttiomyces helicus TaxID=388810 RepID=A0A4P9W6Z5_9FUNG|nr:hypothetical protein BDK51DRAFT_39671 [Blyttiomyces helicus]|eukprot:RKO87145.1 hypothetical protein BDK51DRAFT_39671 [Blyttiomyces helicus]
MRSRGSLSSNLAGIRLFSQAFASSIHYRSSIGAPTSPDSRSAHISLPPCKLKEQSRVGPIRRSRILDQNPAKIKENKAARDFTSAPPSSSLRGHEEIHYSVSTLTTSALSHGHLAETPPSLSTHGAQRRCPQAVGENASQRPRVNSLTPAFRLAVADLAFARGLVVWSEGGCCDGGDGREIFARASQFLARLYRGTVGLSLGFSCFGHCASDHFDATAPTVGSTSYLFNDVSTHLMFPSRGVNFHLALRLRLANDTIPSCFSVSHLSTAIWYQTGDVEIPDI